MQILRIAKTVMPVFTVLFALAGCTRESVEDPGDDTGAAKRLRVVSLVELHVRTVRQTTTQPAIVHAWQQAEIHAKVSGYLIELKVDIGHEVKKEEKKTGDLLAVIAVPEMQRAHDSQAAEVKRLKAIEQRREAEQVLALANKRAAVALSKQAAAQVKQAEAQRVADSLELERVKDLVADNTVARRLQDEAEKRHEASKAAKAAAEAAATSAIAQIDVAIAKIKVAEKIREAAKEETDVAQKKLDEMVELMKYARLTAPFAGIVTERNVDVGDLVRNIQTASQQPRKPLFIIADLRKVRVHVMVPEHDVPLVKVGAAVSLRLHSLSGSPIPGKVTRMAFKLDERTRTMLVEIVLDNWRQGKNWQMLPGMYGEATIILKQKKQAMVLPAEAVRFDEKGNSTVYVIDSNDTVRIVPVKTGIDFGDEIEMTGGLNPGDRIAGPVVGRLKTGQKVRVR